MELKQFYSPEYLIFSPSPNSSVIIDISKMQTLSILLTILFIIPRIFKIFLLINFMKNSENNGEIFFKFRFSIIILMKSFDCEFSRFKKIYYSIGTWKKNKVKNGNFFFTVTLKFESQVKIAVFLCHVSP